MNRSRKIVAVVAAAAALGGLTASLAACGGETRDPIELSASSVSIVVTGYEFGPAVSGIVVKFDEVANGVTKDTFAVKTANKTRAVTDAYCSDANGKKSDTATEYVTLELSMPKMSMFGVEASPFSYDMEKQVNSWAAEYKVKLTVEQGKKFKVGKTSHIAGDYYEYTVESAENRIVPQTATWTKDVYTYTDGAKPISLSRAAWSPDGADTDSGKNPLVIWLHGMGEGGTDIDIDLLGNEVTGLTADNSTNVQHYFQTNGLKGAYVLAVQSPTMWMDSDGDRNMNFDSDGEVTETGKQLSYYTEALYGAITSYVSSNPDIDTDRIYLGGCSNGGYMTMNMMFEHGDYFAAYYPICEAYVDSRISEDMLQSIKDYNIWFLQAANDKTVNPDKFMRPTFKRLLDAGAQNVFATVTTDVRGADVPNQNYDGHWSWIYAFNDDVKKRIDNAKISSASDLTPDNCTVSANMWEWLAAQTKA